MMASRPPLAPLANETESSVSRITREGKKITYKLSVTQQPERARACGAGAKSSADRRPVDPPPVVELRIFESDPNDDQNKTDITFAYNANFFLFATLETARPIAQGRLAGPPTCPVLTGVPVAGMAYLDRPTQAGYFIFPDLSVRHEGRYRLSFNLYEEIKDSKDVDKDTPMQNSNMNSSKPGPPQAFLNFRLEVKTVPFTVYSAKKFPGLATSTSLSRIIAEQGCRVRIRRDVRMRRRGEKRTDDYDFDDDRGFAARSDRYSTPDAYPANPTERARSASISTAVDPMYTYGPEAPRRTSAPEYAYQRSLPPAPTPAPAPAPASAPAPAPASASAPAPPGPPGPPGPPSHAPSYQSHLSFGSKQTQYPAPQMPPTPQSATPTNAYSPHVPYGHHTRTSSNSTDHESGYPLPQPRLSNELPGYPKTALPPLRLEPPKEMNMQSSGEPRSSDHNGYQPLTPSAPRSRTPSNLVTSLPPLRILSGEYDHNPSLAQSPVHDLGSGKRFHWDTNHTLSKRSHEDSFGHDDRPLHNGMRPDIDSYPNKRFPPFFIDSPDEMAYKRANGRIAMKISPALQ